MKDLFLERYKGLTSPPLYPDREFIVGGATYEWIHRLASGIMATVGREAICLCTESKELTAAAILASICGGPEVIIPYAFSHQVIMEARKEAGFRFVLSDRAMEVPGEMELIRPDDCLRGSDAAVALRNPDLPFLKLFTGGSTGKPKTWPKTPRNIFAEAFYLAERFSLSGEDIILSTVPPYHIYGLLFSVIVPFIASARVLGGIYTFPQEIISALHDEVPSILVSIPIHYKALKTDDLKGYSLREAFSSAGMLDEADSLFFSGKTGVAVSEVYGSTETGGIAIRRRAEGYASWGPFDGIAWKIEEERLHVCSPYMSPNLPADADGFFRTGDLADYLGKDQFLLRGRADGIVKVGGKRVDIIDVQEKIKSLPAVRECLVISLSVESSRENEIDALIVGDIDEGAIRKSLAEILEPYSIPKRIKNVDKIPMLKTGKVDRHAVEFMFQ